MEGKMGRNREEMKLAWIKAIESAFRLVINAEGQTDKGNKMVWKAVEDLNNLIQVGSLSAADESEAFTESDGLNSEHIIKFIGNQIDSAHTREEKAKVLLAALEDKDKFGLEEEYLKILRRAPLDAPPTKKPKWRRRE